jgi:hypothetical protein
VDTQNSQKKSRQGSATQNRKHVRFGADEGTHEEDSEHEQYYGRSPDHVARVRAAREAAQRKMEEFGDVSEYDITIIHGQLKEEPNNDEPQPSLDFERKGEGDN